MTGFAGDETLEFDGFAEGGAPDVETGPDEAEFMITPVSVDPDAGNVPLIDPVPSEVVVCPSMVTSTRTSLAGRKANSYSNLGVWLVP